MLICSVVFDKFWSFGRCSVSRNHDVWNKVQQKPPVEKKIGFCLWGQIAADSQKMYEKLHIPGGGIINILFLCKHNDVSDGILISFFTHFVDG